MMNEFLKGRSERAQNNGWLVNDKNVRVTLKG